MFTAQFFVDVFKQDALLKSKISLRGAPPAESIGSEMTGGQSVCFKKLVWKANF